MNGIFITGTDNEAGKTFVTAGIGAMLLKTGLRVGIMKPIASGGTIKEGRLVSKDAVFLKDALKLNDDYDLINPYCLKTPMVPGLAARIDNITIDLDIIKQRFQELVKKHDILLVEGAGGLFSPLTERYLKNADLAKELDLPIIIVSRPTLETINQTLYTLENAQDHKALKILGIILNYHTEPENEIVEKTNPELIEETTGIKIIGIVPHCKYASTVDLKTLQNFFYKKIDISILGRN